MDVISGPWSDWIILGKERERVKFDTLFYSQIKWLSMLTPPLPGRWSLCQDPQTPLLKVSSLLVVLCVATLKWLSDYLRYPYTWFLKSNLPPVWRLLQKPAGVTALQAGNLRSLVDTNTKASSCWLTCSQCVRTEWASTFGLQHFWYIFSESHHCSENSS